MSVVNVVDIEYEEANLVDNDRSGEEANHPKRPHNVRQGEFRSESIICTGVLSEQDSFVSRLEFFFRLVLQFYFFSLFILCVNFSHNNNTLVCPNGFRDPLAIRGVIASSRTAAQRRTAGIGSAIVSAAPTIIRGHILRDDGVRNNHQNEENHNPNNGGWGQRLRSLLNSSML